ncbi:MAG: aromatic ring-hydroxylating dioxygenase subunit alpha [Thermoplasmata archaeon]
MPAFPAPDRHPPVAPEPAAHLSASTPEGSIYWDPNVFGAEMEKLFYRNWLCVGRDEDLPVPGDYLVRPIGNESLLFLRGTDGKVRGFYNVCRHRGTRLVTASEGSGLRTIVCPYHSWTYGSDGRLNGAPHTRELEGFRREEYGLVPVRMDAWGGFLWANLDPDAPALRDEYGAFFDEVSRFPIEQLRRASRTVYEVEANWKILVENYSECYHCAPVHPELNRITHYLSGENVDFFLRDGVHRKHAGGTMTFAGDYTAMTRSGYSKRPPLPGMTAEDRKQVKYWVLFPNLFFSLDPDYLMIHRTWPISPSHSRVENDFLFHPETISQPGFDASDAVGIWDEINRQDWHVCELAQAGTRSRMWHGGRYSEQEALVHDFDQVVRDLMSVD